MKPFVINRKSWHYKMNIGMNDYDFSREGWESRHSDFCSYWRATIFNILKVAIVVSMICFILGVLVFITWQEPVTVGLTLVSIIGFFVFIGGGTYLQQRLSNGLKSESLIAQKYRAHKSKICPMVEFDD